MQQRHLLFLQQIASDYLDLYTKAAGPRRNTTSNYWKNTAETIAYYARLGGEPTDVQLDRIVTNMKTEFITKKTPEDWLALVPKLRENAENAQKLKMSELINLKIVITEENKESHLRQTLHGIANFILNCVEICEYPKESEEFKKGFKNPYEKKVKELKAEKKAKKVAITRCLSENQGLGIEAANKALYDVIYELAMLGVIKEVNNARGLQLLNDYPFPKSNEVAMDIYKEVNFSVPILLHQKQCEWYYTYFQTTVNKISFKQFKQEGWDKIEGKLKNAMVTQSKDAFFAPFAPQDTSKNPENKATNNKPLEIGSLDNFGTDPEENTSLNDETYDQENYSEEDSNSSKQGFKKN